MGLSRLDNFLKSTRGTILYVDPNSLDATDSIENKGNSLTRPFKTIQRALIESSRFSYQRGLDNDRFAKTTILLYPGDHVVDNRPGYIPDGSNNYRLRNGSTTDNLSQFDLSSNFDLASSDNQLHKLNSVHGGVIVPRGTSIVGLDLRKTKIRPKYIPDPENANIEASAVFRVTGACYFWQFSFFDGDPNGQVYKDYNSNLFVPNFSHHKLRCFEYADGLNNVKINDEFITNFDGGRSDLQMYYEKVGIVYGQSSGRAIEPDYPSSGLDIQPKIDEYRIVGSTGESVGISSIRAGDGATADTTITVTTNTAVTGLDVDTPFRIENVNSDYNGDFVVTEKVNSTQIKYTVQNAPSDALPSVSGSSLALVSDTVTSASPYIFNISLRSVYGMCGMLADGARATGFKSMVVAQFTGIGLQKDEKAFVRYNTDTIPTGAYDDYTAVDNLPSNSRARYKPDYKNFHIKVTNNSFIQAVSIFAIGYAEHFVTDNGGDISLTNSNSNFGAVSLASEGFRNDAFSQDDVGYITHIIPPKEIPLTETAIEFGAIDITKTDRVAGVGSTGNLYLFNEKNEDAPPENVVDGYRFGARENDTLRVLVSSAGSVTEYSAKIVMDGSQLASQKTYTVKQGPTGINSIGSYSQGGSDRQITLRTTHDLINGESVRVISENAHLPDGLDPNTVYFAITDSNTSGGITTNVNVKLAKTLNDAINGNAIAINEKGGVLNIVSRVSDKNSGDIGHPVQYDVNNEQWYVNVSTAATENNIFSTIVGLGVTGLGSASARTFVNRKSDNRNSNDTLYRARYVIPASTGGTVARPPTEGFIIQESNSSIGINTTEIQTYFGSGSISNVNQQRNFRFIRDVRWDGSEVHVTTELPHKLQQDDQVELKNITGSLNTAGAAGTAFNRDYRVTGITSSTTFRVGLTTNPGTFTNDTSTRDTSLPYFRRKRLKDTMYVYRNFEQQQYKAGEQDGVYYITLLNSTNRPSVSPFTDQNFSQPVTALFPQTNRDTPISDPPETTSFAIPSLIGEVVIDEPQNSATKENITKYIRDVGVGIAITNLASTIAGTSHTITTNIDHGLNRVTTVGISSGGFGYGSGAAGSLYNAKLVSIGASVTGKHATGKITFNANGEITAVKIMNGGSAYGIGNTLAVVGVATTAGHIQAVVNVTKIYDNVGDTIRISGVSSASYNAYNDVFRITGVEVGAASSLTFESPSAISGFTTTGIGATNAGKAYFYLTGEAVGVTTINYDNNSGIATIKTGTNHGFSVDQKVRLSGATNSKYVGDFVVTENVGLTTFAVRLGVGTVAPGVSGTLFAFNEGVTSNGGNVTVDNENLAGRMIAPYAGITTTLSAAINDATSETVSITNLGNLDINIGDYLEINDEIVRVKTTVAPSDNSVTVFRGVLGTKRKTHVDDTIVRRVEVSPTELRRHSIIRASGHTFEYVGFGPGNYSTAFPDKHDRAISAAEELLSQSTKRDGGINFYTGMNDRGISFAGNKKLSTITGKEEIFDTPVQTVTGEDISKAPALNITAATEGLFRRSVRVEGGDDNKSASEFNGPLVVNNKLTVNSDSETNNLFIQGDATVSRKYSVGIATPTQAGNPGDVIFDANPDEGSYVGWVYSVQNDWKRFGAVSLNKNSNTMMFDGVGIGTTTNGDSTLLVGSGSTQFSVDGSGGVGIGSTANAFALRVIGESTFSGSIVAAAFTGDGRGLTNLETDTLFKQVGQGIGTGIYPLDLVNVGFGTTVPRHYLEVGYVGMGSTSMLVNGEASFVGFVTAKDVFVSGGTTVLGQYHAENLTSGVIRATSIGIGSTFVLQSFQVGSSNTLGISDNGQIFTVSGIGSVGVGTTSARSNLDVIGHARLETVSRNVDIVSPSSNVVTVDLSSAQNFICTASADINHFVLNNAPPGSSEFTLRIDQDSDGDHYAVVDHFQTGAGTSIPVYWPGGGVLPGVTTTANRSDIFAYRTFDGENIASAGLYAVVVGQNFAN